MGAAGLAILFIVILVAPMLLHDLGNYPTGAGDAAVLLEWPPIYTIVVAAD